MNLNSSSPDYGTDGFEKPESTSLMSWINFLETQRNQAESSGNHSAYKKLTKEISETIGGKYGIPETNPDTLIPLIHSIIRTRHRFCGKRHMVQHYRNFESLETESAERKYQLAFISAIDTLASIAIHDNAFAMNWSSFDPELPDAKTFTDQVKQHLGTSEGSSLSEALDESLNHFFLTKPEIVRFAGNIFEIFAPKLTLQDIVGMYSIPTCGGWSVSFGYAYGENVAPEHPVTLTDEEREIYAGYPDLEKTLREKFNESLAKFKVDVYCSSSVAQKAPDGKIFLEYVFDACPFAISDGRVVGKVPPSLFLIKNENPLLNGILQNRDSCIPIPMLRAIYQSYMIAAKKKNKGEDNSSEVTLLSKSGHPPTLSSLANAAYKMGNLKEAVFLCTESADLGNEQAKGNLPIMLCGYANALFKGTFHESSPQKDKASAIDLCRKSADLGHEQAKRNLPIMLSNYAKALFSGEIYESSPKKDKARAIDLSRESAALNYIFARMALPDMLVQYSSDLFQGNFPEIAPADKNKAIDLCREACNELKDFRARVNLRVMLCDYSKALYEASLTSGDPEKIEKAIDLCKESADLESTDAKRNLSTMLCDYAKILFNKARLEGKTQDESIRRCREVINLKSIENLPDLLNQLAFWLFDGIEGFEKNIPRSIELLRESKDLGDQNAISALPTLLSNYAAFLYEGTNGIEKNVEKAIELCREAAALGSESAAANLTEMLGEPAACATEA